MRGVFVMYCIFLGGNQGSETRGCQGELDFFFSIPIWVVKITLGDSHGSMKRMIMHAPLTQGR